MNKEKIILLSTPTDTSNWWYNKFIEYTEVGNNNVNVITEYSSIDDNFWELI
jgi:hypothetical protein